MNYNFNKRVERRNTNSLKYDFAKERGKPKSVLPLWVADMDFPAPQEVIDALAHTANHGIFGYSDAKDSYLNALRNWFSERFDFTIDPACLVKTPGVVFTLATAIRAFTEEGDAVLIQSPVYPCFHDCIITNNRKLIDNPLVYQDRKYRIDFEDFERKIVENDIRLFIFCSPHNPVGRVWRVDELKQIGDICLKHNCLVVSDEVHCDFVYEPHKHHVFSTISPEFANNSIICTAPSKTFNLAGLQNANIFIENESVREQFVRAYKQTGYSQLNLMGLVACQSAYAHGQDWLSQLKPYLAENLDFLRLFLKERLPQIKLVEPEGTYLVWLDCKQLGLSGQALNHFITNKANLWLGDGLSFGSTGEGFCRLNIACPRSVLEQALIQLHHAWIAEQA